MTTPGVYCCTKLVFVGDSNCMCFSSHSEGLGEGYDGDIAFASALETFGGGHNDPISVAFGGMSICYVGSYFIYASLCHWRFLSIYYLLFIVLLLIT